MPAKFEGKYFIEIFVVKNYLKFRKCSQISFEFQFEPMLGQTFH